MALPRQPWRPVGFPASIALLLLGCCALAAHAQAPPDGRALTLDEARTLMWDNNVDLRQLDVSIEQAALLEAQARALVLPTLRVVGVYTLNDDELQFAFPNLYAPLLPYLDSVYGADPGLETFFQDNPGFPDARDLARAEASPSVIQYRHDLRAIVTLTQPVFNARAFPAYRMARIVQQQSRIGRALAADGIDAALTQLYYEALRLQGFVRLREANLALAQTLLAQATIAREEGVGTAFDQNRAEVAARRAERELEQTQTGYQLLIEAIALLVRQEPGFRVARPEGGPAPAFGEGLLREALERDTQLRLLGRQRELDAELVAEVRAQALPVVFAQAQGQLQRASAFGGDAFRWSVSVQAVWDVFAGGMRQALRQERELESFRTALAREAREERVMSALRQLQLEMSALEAQREAAQAERDLAALGMSLAMEGRGLGVTSALEVDLARQQLLMAELALLDVDLQWEARRQEVLRITTRPPWGDPTR